MYSTFGIIGSMSTAIDLADQVENSESLRRFIAASNSAGSISSRLTVAISATSSDPWAPPHEDESQVRTVSDSDQENESDTDSDDDSDIPPLQDPISSSASQGTPD
ncbi:hypothetical protein B0H13DRAFT_1904483 [Mycena leptocephala]|nr:hypothetical protein B0H13DRAFT_1904483 [Mycena leptocephala]